MEDPITFFQNMFRVFLAKVGDSSVISSFVGVPYGICSLTGPFPVQK
jgi:hypothetical protein